MSQTPQICTQCGTHIEPGVRFCSSCGALAPQPVEATAAAAFPQSNPAYPASSPSPNNLPYPMPLSNTEQTTFPNSPYAVSSGIPQMEYANPLSGSSSPSYSNYNSTPAAPVPPPPPPPSTTPDNPYSSMPYYPPSLPVQKRSLLLPILITVVVSAVIGSSGVGLYFLTKRASSNHYGPSSGGSHCSSLASSDSNKGNIVNNSPSRTLNLTVTYAGDQITFTQIQQASFQMIRKLPIPLPDTKTGCAFYSLRRQLIVHTFHTQNHSI